MAQHHQIRTPGINLNAFGVLHRSRGVQNSFELHCSIATQGNPARFAAVENDCCCRGRFRRGSWNVLSWRLDLRFGCCLDGRFPTRGRCGGVCEQMTGPAAEANDRHQGQQKGYPRGSGGLISGWLQCLNWRMGDRRTIGQWTQLLHQCISIKSEVTGEASHHRLDEHRFR